MLLAMYRDEYLLENHDTNTQHRKIITPFPLIPSSWEHCPTLQDKYGYTVAMYMAKRGLIPPTQWEHKSTLHGHDGKTVALLLSENGVIPT